MTTSIYPLLFAMLAGIGVILLLTIRYRVPAFFALLLACVVTGFGVGIPPLEIIALIKEGFGNIMKSLSLVIILGTTLGVLLEKNGSTRVMAQSVLALTGEKRASWAMSMAGFIVGLPIFCDSGYIVLNGLNRPLARRAGISVIPVAVSLATGLYAVHCMVPPHPGASAAASALGVDFGRLLLWGALVALPSMVAGHLWAVYSSRKYTNMDSEAQESVSEKEILPKIWQAFLPVIVPIVLIASKSLLSFESGSAGWPVRVLNVAGDPVVALAAGVLLTFLGRSDRKKTGIKNLLDEAIEKAGSILVIIGAGGAFGAVLAATKPGDHFAQIESLKHLGLLFPFLLTMILKTAQGSSTVAIITASSLVVPLLPALGLESSTARLLTVMSMGAGSMLVSHANDAYFWVIVKFSGLDMKTVLKVYTVATCFMGLTGFIMVYILSLFLS